VANAAGCEANKVAVTISRGTGRLVLQLLGPRFPSVQHAILVPMKTLKRYFLPEFILVIFASTLLACAEVEPPAVKADSMPGADATEVMSADSPSKLANALAGDHRLDGNRSRDSSRHPLETLQFFGLTEEMTVMELWPSGGWYTEVLAPVLRDSGHYYSAQWPKDSDRTYVTAALARYAEKLASRPDIYDQVEVVHIGPGTWDPVAAGTVDMVLTFRAIHNWMGDGIVAEMFSASFSALKPGGIFGVVQHRGDPTVDQDPAGGSGYVTEASVIALATEAGFELQDSSEVNANPKDLKNYAEGVWTLPPNSRLKDSPEADLYLAIGESDRMTLRFVKPETR
jgi:predicted methyltransferase